MTRAAPQALGCSACAIYTELGVEVTVARLQSAEPTGGWHFATGLQSGSKMVEPRKTRATIQSCLFFILAPCNAQIQLFCAAYPLTLAVCRQTWPGTSSVMGSCILEKVPAFYLLEFLTDATWHLCASRSFVPLSSIRLLGLRTYSAQSSTATCSASYSTRA